MLVISDIEAKEILKSKSKKIWVNLYRKKIDRDELKIDEETLVKIASKKGCYRIRNGKVERIEISADHHYKLVLIAKFHAPTIYIDGIHMHRIKDVFPEQDARMKVSTLDIKYLERVLDTCTGLGYTAIEALKKDARVTTIEKDVNVLKIAKVNPWSRFLFRGVRVGRANILIGDASSMIKKFENEFFDKICHDPPAIYSSGELYSLEFYKELYRVLKPNGKIYHYVGEPQKKFQRKDFARGVIERMREVGFKNVKRCDKVKGVIARK
ncbi:MAG: RsmD family RNA methyltransferase [Candidatus Parvarchaeota archaeon]|nr:RsmD family RNA methyltransferase [Candidatus Jingweiarchaeum tengchongense]MCW1298527.1 RsmD family RNA methyltransferase [Candidatus Jingweiarchaeum tengchongense]MCW1300227.1 RsmD family RNA methyltransferase [Candidatus Jingweiarchaeum tengchongense]MCW1304539.1 RsmD family RNA methyltransferase [Candidatus Jingweiarchaeum tengchongense]MCW1305733.1 RsmD family RNA methyltransferase [Candidatus Jingweiarchaeum tengchongense]